MEDLKSAAKGENALPLGLLGHPGITGRRRLLQPVCLGDDVQNRPQDKIRRVSRRRRIYRLIPEEPGVSELGSALEATGLGPVAHIYVSRKSRQVMDRAGYRYIHCTGTYVNQAYLNSSLLQSSVISPAWASVSLQFNVMLHAESAMII